MIDAKEAPPLPGNMPRTLRIIVEYDVIGKQMQVSGHIHPKVLAMKMLADAIHLVADNNEPSIIKPAFAGKPN